MCLWSVCFKCSIRLTTWESEENTWIHLQCLENGSASMNWIDGSMLIPWPMTQSNLWCLRKCNNRWHGSRLKIYVSMSVTLWFLALIRSSLLQFGSKILTSTLVCLANWMASSRLKVEKSPSVDDLHSLLSKASWSLYSCDCKQNKNGIDNQL